MLGMMRIRTLVALGGAALLASCAVNPPPPPPAPVAVAQPSVAPPTNYRWTNGFSEKGYQAMFATVGKVYLKAGENHWLPAAAIPAEGDVNITLDIANQVGFVFKGEQLIGVTNISTGKKGHPTPLGFWTINWKRPMYR